MKKIILVLFLMVFSSPLYVGACSPAFPITGIIIEVEDCEYAIEDNNFIQFDVLVKRNELEQYNPDFEFLTSSAQHFGHIEGYENLDHFKSSNEWVSFLSYVDVGSDSYNTSCGAIIGSGNWSEYKDAFNTFKTVVIDVEGNIIATTNETDINIGLTRNIDDYSKLVYNETSNSFYLEPAVVDWETLNDSCGPSSFTIFFIIAIAIVVYLIIFVVIESIVYFKSEMSKESKVFIFLINLGVAIAFAFSYINSDGVFTLIFLFGILPLLGIKLFYIFKFERRVLPFSIIYTLMEIVAFSIIFVDRIL